MQKMKILMAALKGAGKVQRLLRSSLLDYQLPTINYPLPTLLLLLLAVLAPPEASGAGLTAANVWTTPAGYWIPANTQTNLPLTNYLGGTDLGWLDLTELQDTNVFFQLTAYGGPDGTLSNVCSVTFAPSLDRVTWNTNYNDPAPTVRFCCTNATGGTLANISVVTNGAFFGSMATAYPYYRVVGATNMTARILSNVQVKAWYRIR